MDENTKKRLDQQFAFIREIDREKFIGRQTYLSDGSGKRKKEGFKSCQCREKLV